MKPIFLIGFMCSGKSTLCRALSCIAEVTTVDLDEFIEQRIGMSISQYFHSYGEKSFREIERQCLKQVSTDGTTQVIACGGGTPCYLDNMEFMNSLGTTIYLNANRDVILSRLKEGRHSRPLIANLSDHELKEFIDNKIDERSVYYDKASHQFDSSRLDDSDQIDSTTRMFIRRFIV